MFWLGFPGRTDRPQEAVRPSLPVSAPDEIVELWRSKKRNPHLRYLFGFASMGGNAKARFRLEMGFDVELVGGYSTEEAPTWVDLAGGEPLSNLDKWTAPHLSPTAFTAAAQATDPELLDVPTVWVSTPALPHEHCIKAQWRSDGPLYFWNPIRRIAYRTIDEGASIWRRVAQGEFDIYFETFYARLARMLTAHGRDTRLICLDIQPEMTGDWKRFNPGPDIRAYKDAWRRIVDIIRAQFTRHGRGRPLVMWRPSAWAEFGPKWHNNTWANYVRERPNVWDAFPGEDWADVVGIDLHNPNSLSTYDQWLSYITADRTTGAKDGPQTLFDWIVANTRRTMIGLSEWGYYDRPPGWGGWTAVADPNNAFMWTKRLFDRYGDRMLFALYTSWAQFTSVASFNAAIKAQWRTP